MTLIEAADQMERVFGDCIYKIINRKTSDSYVGCSLGDVRGRFKQHKTALEKGKHYSKKMQLHCNEFGVGIFDAQILEILPKRKPPYNANSFNPYQVESDYIISEKATYNRLTRIQSLIIQDRLIKAEPLTDQIKKLIKENQRLVRIIQKLNLQKQS